MWQPGFLQSPNPHVDLQTWIITPFSVYADVILQPYEYEHKGTRLQFFLSSNLWLNYAREPMFHSVIQVRDICVVIGLSCHKFESLSETMLVPVRQETMYTILSMALRH